MKDYEAIVKEIFNGPNAEEQVLHLISRVAVESSLDTILDIEAKYGHKYGDLYSCLASEMIDCTMELKALADDKEKFDNE